ncbi:MAG: hypothetical protein KC486_20905 [Myxococcales bacterium]|nr:hypothetical protein [Myxococcales bacterium]
MTAELEPTEIQQELVTLANNVDLIRRFRYQDADHAAMAKELVPAAEAVGGELSDILTRLEHHYTNEARGDAMSSAGMLADMSMMSRAEVDARVGGLRGELAKTDAVGSISRAMGLLGTLRRTAVVVENSLADALEGRRRLRSQRELDLLIEIRGSAVDLGLALGAKEPPASQLRKRLQPTEETLDALISRDLYWELPEAERRAASDLHTRVRLWSGGGDGYDSVSGRHLWGALRAFVDDLLKVNERNELIEYDRSIIRMAHSTVFGSGARGGEISAPLFKQLKGIAGRDPAIDRLLATEDRSAQAWGEPLQRLREGL